jgi:hypothetical protein
LLVFSKSDLKILAEVPEKIRLRYLMYQLIEQCNKNVFQYGTPVMVTHTIEPRELDIWVKKVAQESGQQVDWHYFSARAIIRAIGNIQIVDSVIQRLLPEHDELYVQAHQKYSLDECYPPRLFST